MASKRFVLALLVAAGCGGAKTASDAAIPTTDMSADADAVVAMVYADVPQEVWPAARLSVLAQLDYLRFHPHTHPHPHPHI